MNNETAIKSELLKAEKSLLLATDKYDVHFFNLRIKSLKASISGVKPFDKAKIGL